MPQSYSTWPSPQFYTYIVLYNCAFLVGQPESVVVPMWWFGPGYGFDLNFGIISNQYMSPPPPSPPSTPPTPPSSPKICENVPILPSDYNEDTPGAGTSCFDFVRGYLDDWPKGCEFSISQIDAQTNDFDFNVPANFTEDSLLGEICCASCNGVLPAPSPPAPPAAPCPLIDDDGYLKDITCAELKEKVGCEELTKSFANTCCVSCPTSECTKCAVELPRKQHLSVEHLIIKNTMKNKHSVSIQDARHIEKKETIFSSII